MTVSTRKRTDISARDLGCIRGLVDIYQQCDYQERYNHDQPTRNLPGQRKIFYRRVNNNG